MKQLLTDYAQYNRWAHERLTNCILELTTEQQQREVTSSFKGLYKTVLHVWGSETVWMTRLTGTVKRIESDPFSANMQALATALLEIDQQWIELVEGKTESEIIELFSYQNSRGEQFQQAYYLLLHHIFNHSTYHNGQLVTILRQVGATVIPETDFIAWSRLAQSGARQ
jgi:uncharacterized damage-inducible protein DinB